MTITRKSTIFDAQKILDVLDKDERLSQFDKDELVVQPIFLGFDFGYQLVVFNKSTGEGASIGFGVLPTVEKILVFKGKQHNIMDTDELKRYIQSGISYGDRLEEAVEYIIHLVLSVLGNTEDRPKIGSGKKIMLDVLSK